VRPSVVSPPLTNPRCAVSMRRSSVWPSHRILRARRNFRVATICTASGSETTESSTRWKINIWSFSSSLLAIGVTSTEIDERVEAVEPAFVWYSHGKPDADSL
jgi:hypothetical protein